MTLRIAENLTLPDEAVTQTFAILAKRGVGKTYTMLVMAEEMLAARRQVIIADPVGVCWGLRSSADGKSEGLPIAILGGEHGDIPLEPTAGELVAELAVDSRASMVLDMSAMRKGEQVRFMTSFAETLYHKNRAPLHLMLDEADAFAPQRAMHGQERMLGAIEDLVRRGRARGIGLTMTTQRPAVLNKNVLTQVEVLVLLRLIAPQDRAAVNEWVKVHGDAAHQKALSESVASLPIGTAWLWSPGWLDIFKQAKIRERRTFDSSATPKAGERTSTARRLAEVDLAALTTKMQATIERHQADDPKALRKRISELEQQLAKAAKEKHIETVEVPVLKAKELAALEKLGAQLSRVGEQLTDIRQRAPQRAAPTVAAPPAAVERARPIPAVAPVRPPASGNGGLPKAQRLILTVLAQYHAGRSKTQVAVLTGYSHSGGGFNNALSALRTAGAIEVRGDFLNISDRGLELLGPYDPLPAGAELQSYWINQLAKAERSILTVLLAQFPKDMSKHDLANLTGYEASGGGFNNALSKLRTLELIHGSGALRASDVFFEG